MHSNIFLYAIVFTKIIISDGDVKGSSKLKDDRFVVEIEMKFYPIPKCFIVYKVYYTNSMQIDCLV